MVKTQNTTLPIPPKVLVLNKRTKTYLLLVAVVCVWGTIAYKFFSASKPVVSLVENQNPVMSFKPLAKKTDTFSIQELRRDPFLGTIKKKPNTNHDRVIRKAKDSTPIPQMTYLGVLKKRKSKNHIFVLNINKEQFLVKKGQTVENIKILQADSRYMVVSFKEKTITLPIQ